MKRSASEIISRLAEDLAASNAEAKSTKEKERFRRALAGLVFSYWAAKFDHPRALLDRKRETRIMARLEECHDNVSDLLWALDGAAKDEWTMGNARDSSRRYDGIETILRDRGQIEKFGDMMRGFRDNKEHPLAIKYIGSKL